MTMANTDEAYFEHFYGESYVLSSRKGRDLLVLFTFSSRRWRSHDPACVLYSVDQETI